MRMRHSKRGDYERTKLHSMRQGNKVYRVQTIVRVAEILGADEEFLWNVANEMEREDGLIWVYGPGEDAVTAFTVSGVETLKELIEEHKKNPRLLRRSTDPE